MLLCPHLVLGPCTHDSAGLLSAEFGDGAVQHVDLVEGLGDIDRKFRLFTSKCVFYQLGRSGGQQHGEHVLNLELFSSNKVRTVQNSPRLQQV